MELRWSAGIAALLSILLLSGASSSRGQDKTAEIPFSLWNGLIVVEASINGKTTRLLFDSGAARTYVKPSLLEGLKATSSKAISLADGNVARVAVAEAPVCLGGVTVQAQVSGYDMTRFAAGVGLRIDGVVGEDVIGKFSAVLIDYTRRKITLIQ